MTWFIGFSEGDGCFNVRDKGFSFSLVQDEKYVLTHIRDTLGFGKVSKFKDQEKWSYYVEKRYSIYLLILIFNGDLVLNHLKREKFWKTDISNYISIKINTKKIQFLFSISKCIKIHLKKSIRWAKTAGDPHKNRSYSIDAKELSSDEVHHDRKSNKSNPY